jgi:hypothetical protein
MLLQSLRTLCNAQEGAGSIWKYLEALGRTSRVAGRFSYIFRTKFHFADVVTRNLKLPYAFLYGRMLLYMPIQIHGVVALKDSRSWGIHAGCWDETLEFERSMMSGTIMY